MLKTFSSRAAIAAAVISAVAGCSSNGLAPNQSTSSALTNAHGSGMAVRVFQGPAVTGPIVVPLAPFRPIGPTGWPDPKKHKAILFASDNSSGTGAVEMYNPAKANSSPTGSITTGTDVPFGLAVDKKGTLYVANIGNSTVTVYPKGKTSPSLTISNGLSSPYGITVDSKGNIFVSSLGTNDITEYPAGSTTASETINFNSYGQAVGVGVDGKDNVWVACDTSNGVFEILAGTTTVQNSGLTGLGGPIGVSFGLKDQIYVSNFSTNTINLYTYGTTSPSSTITDGISGPTNNGVTAKGLFFQTNQDDNVVGYKKGGSSPFSTLSDSSGAGIASSPLVKK